MERLFTPEEVAEKLQITYKHCLKLIRDGELRAKKIGNKYRISEKDIKLFFYGENPKTQTFQTIEDAMPIIENLFNKSMGQIFGIDQDDDGKITITSKRDIKDE